ncbi:MAG: hypothetical protein U9O55_03955 [Patescibacteria group bacterium]|nr:hypothetical protein [Patescibacteria group bacterium]
MQETMPVRNLEEGKKNIKMDPDKRLVDSLTELKEKKGKIIEKISNAADEEKQILEMDLDDIKNQIRRQEEAIERSLKRNIKRKKIKNLEKDVGTEELAKVFDFQKEKRKREKKKEVDSETKQSVGEKFLADYENFRKRKKI